MDTQTKVCAALLAALSISAVSFFHVRGYTLYYGDAEAHLNIARRVFDSRTPGPAQLGTAWLPLPHLLMMPFVWSDKLWRSGLAGAVPPAICYVIAGLFLFAAARRIFTPSASWGAVAVFALNPNMLYLQSIPMTESIMAAALAALLWATLCYREAPSLKLVLIAAAASLAASLTRYEGWFLIPFVAVFFLWKAPNKSHAFVFAALAAMGPLSWLAHNQFYYSDALAFYHGPYSALAIYQRQLAEGMSRYPGDHNWPQALRYYFAAVRSVAGWPSVILAALGLAAFLFRKKPRWPLVLLSLSPLFYVISMHSSGTPIYVPSLWPFSWYNTRYGLAALPLLAVLTASLIELIPGRAACLAIAVAAVCSGTAGHICWRESQVNSIARRAWTTQAAGYLREHAAPDATLIYYFGDLTGILRQSGMQLRQGLHQDNGVAWDSAIIRPDLFLHDEWAVAIAGDPVSSALQKAQTMGLPYDLVERITVGGAPVIEIYRRKPL